MAHITLQGGPELRSVITSLQKLKRVRAAVKTAATHIKFVLQDYPGQPSAPQPFKTDRQRMYFFWALRNGALTVPYRRGTSPGSRNLKQMWTVEFEDEGMTAVVSNNTDYGPLVQGDAQSAYHKYTGWKTDNQVADQERETITDFLAAALLEEL